MKENRTRARWLLLLPAAALLTLLAALSSTLSNPAGMLAAGSGATARQADGGPVMNFYSRTIETGSPLGNIPSWTGASYDWVAYSTSNEGCGHCGSYITSLHLSNPGNGKTILIRGSRWSYSLSSGGATRGLDPNIVFFNNYLVWSQPGSQPLQDYTYVPGDYACTICYYDLKSGKGGPIQAFATIASEVKERILPLDVDSNGQVLARVDTGDITDPPPGMGAAQGALITRSIVTGQMKVIPAQIKFSDVRQGIFVGSNAIAWIEATRLLVYTPAADKVVQVSAEADLLRGHNSPYIVWHGPSGVQKSTINSSTAEVTSQPLPRVSAYFDVAYGSGDFGDLIAWQDKADSNGIGTLHISRLDGKADLVTKPIAATMGMMSLALDKLLYVTNDQPGYPFFDYQVAWLLPSNAAFEQVWQKADRPVAEHKIGRSWLWGPQPNFLGREPYDKGVGGSRLVQYYDKSRMEINDPGANTGSAYYVTNGLLSTEMIGGEMQIGDIATVRASVACTLPVAGDPRKDNPLTPGYSTLVSVASIHGEHQAPNCVGKPVDEAIDVNGIVSIVPQSGIPAMYAAFAPQTGHNIPDLFWSYLKDMQGTYGSDWTYVLGFPITEAYWTQMRVGGKDYPVLIQAYQRRVLTYTPAFAPEWRVQQGNVGQHYFEWRYKLNAK